MPLKPQRSASMAVSAGSHRQRCSMARQHALHWSTENRAACSMSRTWRVTLSYRYMLFGRSKASRSALQLTLLRSRTIGVGSRGPGLLPPRAVSFVQMHHAPVPTCGAGAACCAEEADAESPAAGELAGRGWQPLHTQQVSRQLEGARGTLLDVHINIPWT